MGSQDRKAAVQAAFQRQFGRPADAVFEAPGRVELIGNHTDYNEGYVLPAAVDRSVLVAAARTSSAGVSVWSCVYSALTTFQPAEAEKSPEAPWSDYIRGVLKELLLAGVDLPGMLMAVDGNVPLGGGLSSSAAIEVATAVAALEMAGAQMSGPEVARLCQKAENEFVGVSCGIMDQFISRLGEAGKAMLLDCRTLDYRMLPLPAGTKIVVADTKKPRTLAGSEYNVRFAQCQEAVRLLKEHLPGIRALRDVTSADLDRLECHLPDVVRRRARHVVSENERVLACAEALEEGRAADFGRMLSESHMSSRDLYDNSSPELDWLVEAALEVDGCLGSRLSGAGFGGCTVSLVLDGAVEAFVEHLTRAYLKRAGLQPDVMVLSAADGARRLA